MKTIVIIQARMGSKRLPGKSLLPLWDDMSLVELIIQRISHSSKIENIILATSDQPNDRALKKIADRCNIPIFYGDETDLINRFTSVLDIYPADSAVRICADNPFIDPMLIDHLVDFFQKETDCDYATNMGPKSGYPDGVGAEIASAETYRRLDRDATKAYEREHVFPLLQNNPKYKTCQIYAQDETLKRPDYRLDIDYPEDYFFIQELIKLLPETKAPFWSTKDIINLLDNRPELLKLRRESNI